MFGSTITTLFAMAFVIALSLSASFADSKTQVAPVTKSSIVMGWQSGSLLSSLVQLGWNNRMPLGIVIEGDGLCKAQVSDNKATISVDQLIRQITILDPNYVAEIEHNTLYVHPRVMSSSTVDALNIELSRFTTEASSAQDIGISLWMYIRALLVPQEGSAFSGGTQHGSETLPPINVSNRSVHQILDFIVTMGQGGFWVMQEVPAQWQSNPKNIPYNIFSYSGDRYLVNSLGCHSD